MKRLLYRIAKFIETKEYRCYWLNAEGLTRFLDILVLSAKEKKTLIVGPTIRFETNNVVQDINTNRD